VSGAEPEWRQFQREAAATFAEAGLSASVDVRLQGARAIHDVDVVVRLGEPDVSSRLWIVECKLWRRPVTKAEVLVLRSIVEDVGAERGVLLSAAGFQPAARLAAQNTNLLLCGTSELRAALLAERSSFGLAMVERRCTRLLGRLMTLHDHTVWPDSHSYGTLFARLNHKQWDHWRANLEMTLRGLADARLGSWPAPAGVAPPRREDSTGENVMAGEVDQFVDTAEGRLNDTEQWLDAAEDWLALTWSGDQGDTASPDVLRLAELLTAPFGGAIKHANAQRPAKRSGPIFMEEELVARLRDRPVQTVGYLPNELHGRPVDRMGNHDDLFLRAEDGEAVVMIGVPWGGASRDPGYFAHRVIFVDAMERVDADLDRCLHSLGRLVSLVMFEDTDGIERAARLDFERGASLSVWVDDDGRIRYADDGFPDSLVPLAAGRML
jgi:hypothetical protein